KPRKLSGHVAVHACIKRERSGCLSYSCSSDSAPNLVSHPPHHPQLLPSFIRVVLVHALKCLYHGGDSRPAGMQAALSPKTRPVATPSTPSSGTQRNSRAPRLR